MATYTSYLNLEKPTTSETFNLLKMNQNWDKIDAGVSALNSKFTSFIGNDTTSDCNSETATGFKKAINSTVNTPYAGHFVIFTFNYSQNEMIQFAISTNANAIYFRYYNSSWSSWKMLGWNS